MKFTKTSTAAIRRTTHAMIRTRAGMRNGRRGWAGSVVIVVAVVIIIVVIVVIGDGGGRCYHVVLGCFH